MNKFNLILTWALPISLCFHVIEEFIFPGGFIQWYHNYKSKFATVNQTYYFWINAVAIMYAFLLAVLGKSKGVYFAILVLWGYLCCNAIFTHLRGAIRTKQYSPGMITGIFLYFPFASLSYVSILKNGILDIRAVAFGILLSPVLEVVFLHVKKPGM